MEKISPPIPIEVVDLNNFARLSLAFSDGPQLLWKMKYNSQTILALFTAYTFWSGDVPILSFVKTDNATKPFLAYKSDSEKGEELFFSDHIEDVRFKYGSFIELKSIPLVFFDGGEDFFCTFHGSQTFFCSNFRPGGLASYGPQKGLLLDA